MADFKDEISPEAVSALARELAAAWPAFPGDAFAEKAGAGLEDLELMARVRHVAAVLARHLPERFADTVEVFDRALRSATFDGWITLPCVVCVADVGIEEPDLALPLLSRLSPRFSSEGPVRPFIERHPDLAFEHFRRWTADPDEHVRRLASEGTRPRLPWASRVTRLIEDPAPGIDLLDRLYDDESAYVRRSVANHLNDVSKDHPALALSVARRWLDAGGEHTDRVVRHGLRTLIKAGDPEALALVGFASDGAVALDELTVEPERIRIGEAVTIGFTLSAEAEPTPVMIDYRVHYAGARGPRKPKTFKLTTRVLEPGAPQRITRRHAFRHVSIRRLFPGPHLIELQVNGRIAGSATVELEAGDGGA